MSDSDRMFVGRTMHGQCHGQANGRGHGHGRGHGQGHGGQGHGQVYGHGQGLKAKAIQLKLVLGRQGVGGGPLGHGLGNGLSNWAWPWHAWPWPWHCHVIQMLYWSRLAYHGPVGMEPTRPRIAKLDLSMRREKYAHATFSFVYNCQHVNAEKRAPGRLASRPELHRPQNIQAAPSNASQLFNEFFAAIKCLGQRAANGLC